MNVQCLKCKQNKFNTLSLEFKFHDEAEIDGQVHPQDITVNNRGAPCHGLHYVETHGYLGLNAADPAPEVQLNPNLSKTLEKETKKAPKVVRKPRKEKPPKDPAVEK